MRAGTAKDALARLRWKERVDDWNEVEVVIRHRGARRDEKSVTGERITHLGASFFEIDGETSIPYHRILRIFWRRSPVYVRSRPSDKSA